MKHKTSIFWTLPKAEFQALLNECHSFADILKKRNMCVTGHQYAVIKTRIANDRLDISHFDNRKSFGINQAKRHREVPAESLFKKDSLSGTCTVKKRILQEKLIPYQCSICENVGVWQGEPLTLQLDHKNGNRTDHRIDNLRFLCPNCHSQTPTYGKKTRP